MIYFDGWYMSLNSYSEICIHDVHQRKWWESSVFRIDYPDWHQECRKEYLPHISSETLEVYHTLHNLLSKYPVEVDTDFSFEEQHIHKVRFSILPLGDTIEQACSLHDRTNFSVTTIPYVEGHTLMSVIEQSDQAFTELYRARTFFISSLVTQLPVFDSKYAFVNQLNDINMKCSIHNGVMDVIVTDICKRISNLDHMCNGKKIQLFNALM